LRVNREFVRIRENHGFENRAIFQVNIRLREKLQFLADEAYALSVRTIRAHNIVFHRGFITAVYLVNKPVQNIRFSRAVRSIKNNVWDFPVLDEYIQFVMDVLMDSF
jgi:hypothetical protein